ncbi:hypothetical protein BaRGS_00002104 [Batillaria attramentaria]|uniref:Uncharacterized protein n=1 Tax=Batillaria attramentaria TaxID=370345 RepID=A0ABD0M3Y3_9CAEN
MGRHVIFGLTKASVIIALFLAPCCDALTDNDDELAKTILPVSAETTDEALKLERGDAVDEIRLALTKLKRYIQSLTAAKEKVAPLKPVDGLPWPKVRVNATVSIMSVLGVDDAQQTVRTSVFLRLHWRDEALRWNVSQYNGLKFVELPVTSLWTPNVLVCNSVETQVNLFEMVPSVIVDSEGWVHAALSLVVDTMCKMDLTMYPYDEQFCPVVFFSQSKYIIWNVADDRLGESVAASLSYGNEWDLLETRAEVFHVKEYDEDGPMIMMRLQRKTTFYTVCLVTPMTLTSFMNTLVFLVPLQSGEKVSFLVTIFVSTSVFVSYFTTMMPRGLDSFPATIKLLICVMMESLLSLFATIIILRRFHQEQASSIRQGHQGETNRPSRESTRLSSAPGAPTSQFCCRGNPRAYVVNDTSQEFKPEEKAANKKEADVSGEGRQKSFRLTSHWLDRICFWVACVGNTTFLLAIILCTLSNSEYKKADAGF